MSIAWQKTAYKTDSMRESDNFSAKALRLVIDRHRNFDKMELSPPLIYGDGKECSPCR
ncbi:hypothetical protein ACFOUO_08780 [Salinithrix halophila]|uniref:Uncharacterized protein n=1 Tax=Salinithrix halophila TaxID=1485204 RepID=A0ABV8JEX9_9BACL